MLRPVLIIWEDATFHRKDMTFEKAKAYQPIILHTVGFLIKEDEKHTTICMEYADKTDNDAARNRNIITIPNGCIKTITKLKSEKNSE